MQKLIRACVSILPKPLQELYYKYEDKWLYLFFGVLTTVVSFVAAGLSKMGLEAAGFGRGAVADISTVISWICAVTFAYVTNRLWVFDSHVSTAKELTKEAASFYSGRLFTLAVEWVIMKLGYSKLHFNYWVVKIIANIVVLILNYVISKIFVFKNKENKESTDAAAD